MPKVPNPDALGLNDNSAVLKHTADTEKLLQGVVLTSPASSSGKEAEEQGLQYHCSDYLDALIDPAKKAEMLDSFKSTHNALINYKSAEAKQ